METSTGSISCSSRLSGNQLHGEQQHSQQKLGLEPSAAETLHPGAATAQKGAKAADSDEDEVEPRQMRTAGRQVTFASSNQEFPASEVSAAVAATPCRKVVTTRSPTGAHRTAATSSSISKSASRPGACHSIARALGRLPVSTIPSAPSVRAAAAATPSRLPSAPGLTASGMVPRSTRTAATAAAAAAEQQRRRPAVPAVLRGRESTPAHNRSSQVAAAATAAAAAAAAAAAGGGASLSPVLPLAQTPKQQQQVSMRGARLQAFSAARTQQQHAPTVAGLTAKSVKQLDINSSSSSSASVRSLEQPPPSPISRASASSPISSSSSGIASGRSGNAGLRPLPRVATLYQSHQSRTPETSVSPKPSWNASIKRDSYRVPPASPVMSPRSRTAISGSTAGGGTYSSSTTPLYLAISPKTRAVFGSSPVGGTAGSSSSGKAGCTMGSARNQAASLRGHRSSISNNSSPATTPRGVSISSPIFALRDTRTPAAAAATPAAGGGGGGGGCCGEVDGTQPKEATATAEHPENDTNAGSAAAAAAAAATADVSSAVDAAALPAGSTVITPVTLTGCDDLVTASSATFTLNTPEANTASVHGVAAGSTPSKGAPGASPRAQMGSLSPRDIGGMLARQDLALAVGDSSMRRDGGSSPRDVHVSASLSPRLQPFEGNVLLYSNPGVTPPMQVGENAGESHADGGSSSSRQTAGEHLGSQNHSAAGSISELLSPRVADSVSSRVVGDDAVPEALVTGNSSVHSYETCYSKAGSCLTEMFSCSSRLNSTDSLYSPRLLAVSTASMSAAADTSASTAAATAAVPAAAAAVPAAAAAAAEAAAQEYQASEFGSDAVAAVMTAARAASPRGSPRHLPATGSFTASYDSLSSSSSIVAAASSASLAPSAAAAAAERSTVDGEASETDTAAATAAAAGESPNCDSAGIPVAAAQEADEGGVDSSTAAAAVPGANLSTIRSPRGAVDPATGDSLSACPSSEGDGDSYTMSPMAMSLVAVAALSASVASEASIASTVGAVHSLLDSGWSEVSVPAGRGCASISGQLGSPTAAAAAAGAVSSPRLARTVSGRPAIVPPLRDLTAVQAAGSFTSRSTDRTLTPRNHSSTDVQHSGSTQLRVFTPGRDVAVQASAGGQLSSRYSKGVQTSDELLQAVVDEATALAATAAAEAPAPASTQAEAEEAEAPAAAAAAATAEAESEQDAADPYMAEADGAHEVAQDRPAAAADDDAAAAPAAVAVSSHDSTPAEELLAAASSPAVPTAADAATDLETAQGSSSSSSSTPPSASGTPLMLTAPGDALSSVPSLTEAGGMISNRPSMTDLELDAALASLTASPAAAAAAADSPLARLSICGVNSAAVGAVAGPALHTVTEFVPLLPLPAVQLARMNYPDRGIQISEAAEYVQQLPSEGGVPSLSIGCMTAATAAMFVRLDTPRLFEGDLAAPAPSAAAEAPVALLLSEAEETPAVQPAAAAAAPEGPGVAAIDTPVSLQPVEADETPAAQPAIEAEAEAPALLLPVPAAAAAAAAGTQVRLLSANAVEKPAAQTAAAAVTDSDSTAVAAAELADLRPQDACAAVRAVVRRAIANVLQAQETAMAAAAATAAGPQADSADELCLIVRDVVGKAFASVVQEQGSTEPTASAAAAAAAAREQSEGAEEERPSVGELSDLLQAQATEPAAAAATPPAGDQALSAEEMCPIVREVVSRAVANVVQAQAAKLEAAPSSAAAAGQSEGAEEMCPIVGEVVRRTFADVLQASDGVTAAAAAAAAAEATPCLDSGAAPAEGVSGTSAAAAAQAEAAVVVSSMLVEVATDSAPAATAAALEAPAATVVGAEPALEAEVTCPIVSDLVARAVAAVLAQQEVPATNNSDTAAAADVAAAAAAAESEMLQPAEPTAEAAVTATAAEAAAEAANAPSDTERDCLLLLGQLAESGNTRVASSLDGFRRLSRSYYSNTPSRQLSALADQLESIMAAATTTPAAAEAAGVDGSAAGAAAEVAGELGQVAGISTADVGTGGVSAEPFRRACLLADEVRAVLESTGGGAVTAASAAAATAAAAAVGTEAERPAASAAAIKKEYRRLSILESVHTYEPFRRVSDLADEVQAMAAPLKGAAGFAAATAAAPAAGQHHTSEQVSNPADQVFRSTGGAAAATVTAVAPRSANPSTAGGSLFRSRSLNPSIAGIEIREEHKRHVAETVVPAMESLSRRFCIQDPAREMLLELADEVQAMAAPAMAIAATSAAAAAAACQHSPQPARRASILHDQLRDPGSAGGAAAAAGLSRSRSLNPSVAGIEIREEHDRHVTETVVPAMESLSRRFCIQDPARDSLLDLADEVSAMACAVRTRSPMSSPRLGDAPAWVKAWQLRALTAAPAPAAVVLKPTTGGEGARAPVVLNLPALKELPTAVGGTDVRVAAAADPVSAQTRTPRQAGKAAVVPATVAAAVAVTVAGPAAQDNAVTAEAGAAGPRSSDAAAGSSSSSAGSLLASTGAAAGAKHMSGAGSSATASPRGLLGTASALRPAGACEEQQGIGQVGQMIPTPRGCATRFTLTSLFSPSKKKAGKSGKKTSGRT